jgi:hypothetical protein
MIASLRLSSTAGASAGSSGGSSALWVASSEGAE